MQQASGDFKIQMEPQAPANKGHDNIKNGRLSFRKAYAGTLEAIGLGEMLSVQCGEEGHAGYVAVEQIKGKLDGKKGGFAVQHFGIKTPQNSELRIDILPGSGAGELVGIAGQMIIRTEGRNHFYEINYSMPEVDENSEEAMSL